MFDYTVFDCTVLVITTFDYTVFDCTALSYNDV